MDLDDGQIASIISRSSDGAAAFEDDPVDLRPFAEQLIAIAQALRSQDTGTPEASNIDSPASNEPTQSSPRIAQKSLQANRQGQSATRQIYAQMARDAYAIRRQRTGIFTNDVIFGEPAWDILLDLYIAHADDKLVSVSSACIGSASPPTTGLRWLGVLESHELIAREHDPEDQRRVLVRLTDRAVEAMDTHFANVAKRRDKASD